MQKIGQKMLGAGLSLVFFAVNVVYAHASDEGFWQERRRAVSRRVEVFSASVALGPASTVPFADALRPRPVSLTSALSFQTAESLPRNFIRDKSALFGALNAGAGSVRAVRFPVGAPTKTVVHVLDVHQNFEAQTHISETVTALTRDGAVGVVALEGAWGNLDLHRYRQFSDRDAVQHAADFLLRENKISGPIRSAMTTATPLLPFVGVDDPLHYKANVNAVRWSSQHVFEDQARCAQRRESLEKEKQRVYSKDLKSLDAVARNWRKGQERLPSYVKTLTAGVPEKSLSPAIKTFLRASALESRLDFKAVESDRTRLVQRLSLVLKPEQFTQLAQDSVSYRAGELRYADYYDRLEKVCQGAGVSLTGFPFIKDYLRYVLTADGISVDDLNRDLEEAERWAFYRRAKTSEEKRLVQEDSLLCLQEKLLDFALVPSEWLRYQKEKRDASLANYEVFYQEAQTRDDSMARNLLTAMGNAKTDTALLVTGGFHADGISKRLTQAGAVVIEFSPRVDRVDALDGAKALSVFSREKTPLDVLFAGEKLFLAPSPVLGLGAAPAGVAARRAARSPLTENELFLLVNESIGRLGGTGFLWGTKKDDRGRLVLTFVVPGEFGRRLRYDVVTENGNIQEIRESQPTDHPSTLAWLWESLARRTKGRVGSSDDPVENVLLWAPWESAFLATLSGFVAVSLSLNLLPLWGLGGLAGLGFFMGFSHRWGTYTQRNRSVVRSKASLRASFKKAVFWGVWPTLWACVGVALPFPMVVLLSGGVIFIVTVVHWMSNRFWLFRHRIENTDDFFTPSFFLTLEKEFKKPLIPQTDLVHAFHEIFRLLAQWEKDEQFLARNDPVSSSDNAKTAVSQLKMALSPVLLLASRRRVHRFDVAVSRFNSLFLKSDEISRRSIREIFLTVFQTALSVTVSIQKKAGILPFSLDIYFFPTPIGLSVLETKEGVAASLSLRVVNELMDILSTSDLTKDLSGTPADWDRRVYHQLQHKLAFALLGVFIGGLDWGTYLKNRKILDRLTGFIADHTALRELPHPPGSSLVQYDVQILGITFQLGCDFHQKKVGFTKDEALALLDKMEVPSLDFSIKIFLSNGGADLGWRKIDMGVLRGIVPRSVILRVLRRKTHPPAVEAPPPRRFFKAPRRTGGIGNSPKVGRSHLTLVRPKKPNPPSPQSLLYLMTNNVVWGGLGWLLEVVGFVVVSVFLGPVFVGGGILVLSVFHGLLDKDPASVWAKIRRLGRSLLLSSPYVTFPILWGPVGGLLLAVVFHGFYDVVVIGQQFWQAAQAGRWAARVLKKNEDGSVPPKIDAFRSHLFVPVDSLNLNRLNVQGLTSFPRTPEEAFYKSLGPVASTDPGRLVDVFSALVAGRPVQPNATPVHLVLVNAAEESVVQALMEKFETLNARSTNPVQLFVVVAGPLKTQKPRQNVHVLSVPPSSVVDVVDVNAHFSAWAKTLATPPSVTVSRSNTIRLSRLGELPADSLLAIPLQQLLSFPLTPTDLNHLLETLLVLAKNA